MHALIYESNHGGHRLNYVRLLVEALRKYDVSITVVTSTVAPASEEFKGQLLPLLPHFRCEPVLDVGPDGSKVSDASMFLAAVKRFSPDHVYIPYADVLAQNLGILRLKKRFLFPEKVEVEALMMRGGFAYPPANSRQKIKLDISWRLANSVPWAVLHHLDPLVFVALKSKGARVPSNLRLIPDPVELVPQLTPKEARHILGLPLEGRFIGCAGALDERKGMDLLVEAFAAQPRSRADRLLLAGRMTPGVRSCVEKANQGKLEDEKIIVLDRYLSNGELDTVLSALDVVCTPYPRHFGSASFVIRAVAAGRPVLSTDFGWCGYVVPRFALGECCNVLNREVFSNAISKSLDAADDYRPEERTRQFREFHTPENFAAHWTRRLRERLGSSSQVQPVYAEKSLPGLFSQ